MKTLLEKLKAHGIRIAPEFNHGQPLRDDSQWFVGHEYSINGKVKRTARFGDFRTDVEESWESEDVSLSPEEMAEFERQKEETAKVRQAAKEAAQADAAVRAAPIWEGAITRGTTPYLEKKGLTDLFGARIDSENTGTLLIPARDTSGKLWGLQRIYSDGKKPEKQFMSGMRIKGCYHWIDGAPLGQPERDPSYDGELYVAEGFATGASVHLATGHPVACAFNAGNLLAVTRALREKYPSAKLVIAADNDRWTRLRDGTPINPGFEKAEFTSAQTGAEFRLPVFRDLTGGPTDFNDLHSRQGLEEVKRQLERKDDEKLAHEAFADDYFGGKFYHEDTKYREGTRAQGEAAPSAEDAEKEEAKAAERKTFELTLKKFEAETHYKMLGGSKICYRWTGTHYVEIGDQYIRQYAQEHLKPKPERKKREEFLDRIQISNLMDPSWFNDTTDRHINFINGVLNIDTGGLSPHTPARGFRYVLNYKYDPSALCPVFDAMMKNITCGDKELEKILDEFMGYALSFDRYWLHKSLLLTGDGENGKSTWMNVLKQLAGEGNYGTLFMKDLNEAGNRQMLDGKLFNISAEVPKKGLFDTSLIKAMSSGEEVVVRQIYKRPYSFKNRAKLIYACNELPDSTDTTRGFFRRFIIVPFNAIFNPNSPGYDPHIEEKLNQELPGIFNRALAGYKNLTKQKRFTEARASKSALEQYQLDNDSAARWVAENIICDTLTDPPKNFKSIATIYLDYARDMENENVRPLTKVDFGRRLSKLIPDFKDRFMIKKIDHKATRILINVQCQNTEQF